MTFSRVKRLKSESRTLCWAIAINRKNKDGTLWMPSTFSLICGKHFIGGKPVNDKDDPDFIPSIFPSPEQLNSNDEEHHEFFQSRISAMKELKNLVSKIELHSVLLKNFCADLRNRNHLLVWHKKKEKLDQPKTFWDL